MPSALCCPSLQNIHDSHFRKDPFFVVPVDTTQILNGGEAQTDLKDWLNGTIIG